MATVRELQAQFIAKANGFKSTIQGIKKDVNNLARDTNKATSSMGKGFKDGVAGIQSNMNKASTSLRDFGDGLGHASKKVSDVGWSLTKKLTIPAGLATAAVGGLVAKLGWDRLKSVDEAQAQLKGLGYTAEDVERITGQVTRAIEGGMTTMGEGTAIAAGALAAGVKEGAELERYIRLVGDAAVGANRPVEEMAMIFNRVQGGGKLMTRELNMIEMGMPGFAQAMSKHLGVSQEAFREMVTEGKVSSKDFLIVMDDFAGGMAEAYSETWSGMVANTKAYVAILGENLLGGVFKKSKESIAEFIELISSPEVQKKAAEMGESLGKSFTKIVDGAKSVVKWFMELDTKYQKMILSSAAIAIALGPFLIMVGKVGSGVAFFVKGLGTLIGFLAKVLTPIKSLSTSTGLAGRAFTFLSGTAGVVIGWIGAFVGIIVMAYKKSEPFRNSISNIGTAFKNLWERIKDLLPSFGFVKDEFGAVKSVAMTLYDGLKQLADVIFRVIGSAFAFLVNKLTFAIDIFVALLSGVEHFAEGWKRIFSGDFKGAIESFSTGVKTMVSNVKEVFSNMLSSVWGYIKDVTPKWVKSFLTATGDILKSVGTFALELPGKVLNGIAEGTKAIISGMPGWSLAFARGLDDIIMKFGSWSASVIKWLGNAIVDGSIYIYENIPKWTKAFISELQNILKSIGSWASDLGIKVYQGINNVTKKIVTSIVDWSVAFAKGLGNILIKIGVWARELPSKVIKGVKDTTPKITVSIGEWVISFAEGLGEILKGIGTWAKELPGKVGEGISHALPKITEKLKEWKDTFSEKTKEITSDVWEWAKALPWNIAKGLKEGAIFIWNTLTDWKETVDEKTSNLSEDIVEWAKEIPGKIGKALGNGAKVFDKWIMEQHEENKKFYGGLAEKAGKWLGDKVGEITKGLAKWGVAFADFFKELPGEIKIKAIEMWETFSENFLEKKDNITEKLGEWGGAITGWFAKMPGKIKDKAVEMWTNFKDNFIDKKENITEGMESWTTSISDWFRETGGNIKEKATKFGTNFKDGIVEAKDNVIEGFKNWWQGVQDWFSDLFKSGEVKKEGKKIVKNIGEGVEENEDDILSKVGEIILKIPGYILGIGAILLFAVGRELMRNVGKGISAGWSLVGEVLDTFWTDIKEVFNSNQEEVRKRLETNWLGRMFLSIYDWAVKVKKEISEFWENTKQKFKEKAAEIYLSFKESWLGKMIFAVIDFALNFKTRMSEMWSNVTKTFKQKMSEIVTAFKNSWIGQMISNVISFAKNFKQRMSEMWESVKEKFKQKINEIFQSVKNSFIGRIITNIVNFARNFKTNISNMWTSLKNTFTSFIESIRKSIANSFVGRILESGRNLKTNFIKLITDMWDGVKKQFNNIVDGAKALPGRIGDGIRSARQKAINGMKSVGNALIRWGGIPFNKVVDGVNWITTKLGVKKNIGKWDYPQYAKGTKGHPGGGAILGDGVGSNAGPELTMLPDGKAFMSADSPTLYPNLPKGTEVLSATDTRKFMGAVPKYAKGTSKYYAYSQESKKKRQANTKKALKKGNESIDDVWSYIKSPGKLLNLALEKFGAKVPDNLGNFKDMITGAFGKVKSAALSKVKDTFKKQESAIGPAGPSSPGAAAWRSHIKLASATMNANASASEVNGIIAQINRESGGNQRIVQSNAVWDVNTAAGNPARGLLQYIPQTFNAYKTRGHGNIYSGYDQLRAFFNNSTWRRDLPYGRRGWGPRGARRGYADGGIVDTKQLAWIAEGGWAESIISHDPAKHASQKSIWEKTGNALGFSDENDSIKLLKRITEILEKEKDSELLKKIATAIEKGHIIEMDKTKIADILHEPLKTKDAEYSVGRYF